MSTYELRVENYLVGTGPQTVLFQEALNQEDGLVPVGASGLFFLTPAPEWGPDGYASFFGRGGVLSGENGTMVFLRPQSEEVRFLKGRSMASVVAQIVASKR